MSSYFDTWVFKKTVEFAELKGFDKKDWEDVEGCEGFDEFVQSKIAEEQIPVYVRHYEGQETTTGFSYMLYIKNKSDEWDLWIIRFFSSAEEAKAFCEKKNFLLTNF